MTDQTSAHDPLNGYVPAGLTVEQADVLRARDPDDYLRRVGECVLAHVGAIRDAAGARAPRRSTTATRCAASPQEHGDEDAFAYPGFVPAYIRPLFCEGKGPFRWVALSGDPADIARDRRGDPRPVRRPGAHPPLDRAGARSASRFQGLPARICWLGYGERHLAGLRFNEMVASRRAARRRS